LLFAFHAVHYTRLVNRCNRECSFRIKELHVF
jgi:hypothetical protein